ncbi:hypothetical protein D7W81_11090 [Corallococcus aberystwythensis]|uniref:Uncharacterized protein n=1 Tax=Corallococcus aberystwythensis TaxID=2316722 RepID=A0A3A8QNL5_9BACT|nr:hypothetical protein D7W81_11090 [Corallococcus aberystwythensis]
MDARAELLDFRAGLGLLAQGLHEAAPGQGLALLQRWGDGLARIRHLRVRGRQARLGRGRR